MKQGERTRTLLLKHLRTYPNAKMRDFCKLLHQSAFGCEHMLTSPSDAVARIRREAELAESDAPLIEPLDGKYSRVHLSYLDRGLDAGTLGRLFFLSAKHEPDGTQLLEEKLDVMEMLIDAGELPFSADAFAQARTEWRKNGYGAISHSEVFRNSYHPAYRVISDDYVPFLPLLARLDVMQKDGAAVTLAIDGGSASGKTTLALLLRELYGCTVFHMDDFFLQPKQRTPDRLAEPGGNVDRERFLKEVLLTRRDGKTVYYRRYDCRQDVLCTPIPVAPEKMTVIEGTYSMHPALAEHYDLSVFLDIGADLQAKRIHKRNSPQAAQRFFSEWIPLEKLYFDQLQVKESCDMCVRIEEC